MEIGHIENNNKVVNGGECSRYWHRFFRSLLLEKITII